MGEVMVEVTVTNGGDAARKKRFDGVVDTGATGLILPLAWKEDLGELETLAMVDLETADQRIVTAEICGPVWIRIDGFRRFAGEATFVEMAPGPHGYQPLVGYTLLEICGVVIDLVSRRLVARMTLDLKSAACA